MRDATAIGVILATRREVHPFSKAQIALLQNFAAQAVIAIENNRLLGELRQRTADLSESLEQQTATAEVLKVISGSSGDLAPVFESLLANAKRLCDAKFGTLLLREGSALRCVAIHGATAEYTEARQRAPVIEPAPDTALGRVLKTEHVVQIADIQKVPGYVANPVQAPIVQLAGARSILSVPMLREKELVGVVEIYRQEVQPFTDKQIALLQNFAAQAVIAIENARLLSELRESLEQQTAAADVLEVISSSPGELEPVFKTILETAMSICEAPRKPLSPLRTRGCSMNCAKASIARPRPPTFSALSRVHPKTVSVLSTQSPERPRECSMLITSSSDALKVMPFAWLLRQVRPWPGSARRCLISSSNRRTQGCAVFWTIAKSPLTTAAPPL
jgi:GAF domain-containing protein